ncbi:galactose-3-O-sulfotransferase 2-like [Xenia sp. Carnegie-2017]|uniref:galactose-3-O-sulfotransferase 2-like n=1 Tax=Xenia sp. Carnegie-2017 TaxID=2897299 RepID=UPI001F04B34C|nr:galactose-3-O-sulfotransferase 2-like [Xenia sp. Carnegie-2017]
MLKKFTVTKRLNFIKNPLKTETVFGQENTNVITSVFLCPERASKGNCNVTAKKAISKIHTQFDLVLIGDHLDESLILMKNYLNWSITDVTYTSSKNEFHLGVAPTLIQNQINKSKKFDQVIYEHFNKSFWEQVATYSLNFKADVQRLRILNQKLKGQCQRPNGIKESGDGKDVCRKMQWADKEYVAYFKKKYVEVSHEGLNLGLIDLKKSLKIYFNMTVKEIEKYFGYKQ